MKKGETKNNLNQQQLNLLISSLLEGSFPTENGRKLARGAVSRVAGEFLISTRQVSRLWKRAQRAYEDTGVYQLYHRREGNCGGPPLYDDDDLKERALQVSMEKRGTLRAVANALGVSVATVHKKKKQKVILSHTNSIKPFLSEQNMLVRALYCVDEVIQQPSGGLVFQPGYLDVHVDEKWFEISQRNKRIYLVPGEEAPLRTCKHKSHIMKVMFLAATARPRFDAAGNCVFDGKIGIWPFVAKKRAERSSVNRPAGTMETKNVSVTKEVYHRMLIDNVVPAIRAKWPADDRRCVVRLQQDNAPSHRQCKKKKDDEPWVAELETLMSDPQHRVRIAIKEQPPNSPDTNINDLGFFASLQSVSWTQTPATTMDGLIDNVKKAFDEYKPDCLNRIWLTHQAILNEILASNGSNNYSIPHLHKDRLLKSGQLPSSISLSDHSIQNYFALTNDEEE